jgi:hypothetical protein
VSWLPNILKGPVPNPAVVNVTVAEKTDMCFYFI